MLHRVNTLQFEAVCATEAQAFEMRHQFSQTWQGQIAAVIDSVCSRYVSEEEWIQVERIEVNLRYFDIRSFEKIFTAALSAKFDEAFSKKINLIPVSEKGASRQVSLSKLLIHFLQTGTVPWWAEDATLDVAKIFIEVAEKQREPLYHFLERERLTPLIWERISMQMTTEVHKLVISFFPKLAAAEKRIVQWSALFAERIARSSTDKFSSQALAALNREFILFHASRFFAAEEAIVVTEQLIRQYAVEIARITSIGISSQEVTNKIIAFEQAAGAPPVVDFISITEDEPEIVSTQADTPEASLREKFTVHTAGAVFLAPYLRQLFTHLHLLEHGEWKDKASHNKAVHLTRYLATGEQMCAEHSLVLEKVLCGMELSDPMPRSIALTEEESAEANELLKSVIANWDKLKNTSVNGLRETFLKRDGILTKNKNGWLLQVERKTVDILLDDIPWSYATVAFAWNRYIIFTEW